VWQSWSHLEKYITLGKTGHTWKKDLHLVKWVTPRKMGQIGKMGHTWEKGSQKLEK